MRGILVSALCGLLAVSVANAGKPDPAAVLQQDLAQIKAWEDTRSRGRGGLEAFTVDSRVAVRVAAVRALGRLQEDAAEAPLVKALDDLSALVRAEAAFGLGQLPKVTVAPLLARLEKESEAGVKHRLLEAIGKRADPIEADALLKFAQDKDPDLRARARVALAMVARRESGRTAVLVGTLSVWLKDSAMQGRRGAAFFLQQAKALKGPPVLAAAIACAKDPDAVVRLRCVVTLKRLGEAAIPTLMAASKDADWRVQTAAVRGLAGSPASLAKVLQAAVATIKNNPGIFATAQLQPTLAALDAARAAPVDPAVISASKALFEAAKGVVAPPTVAFGAHHLRCRAAVVLDRARGKVSQLKKCGAEALPPVLTEAWTADILAKGPHPFKRLLAFYESTGSPGRVAVLGHLFSKAAHAERQAKKGRRGDRARDAASELLATALSDSDPAVVGTAAEVVGRLNLVAFEAHLLSAYRRMMAAREWEAVLGIFEAMAKTKSKRAVAVLEQHTTHAQRAIRRGAEEALKTIVGGAHARQAVLPPMMALDEVPPAKSLAEPSKWIRAIVHTQKGPVKLRLLGEAAPLTVKNFVRLAQKGFYDGKIIHRVVPGFVAQGGDPRGDGWGGPGYTIRCEINPQPFGTGAVGMALAGKDTGSSQFFITHAPHPHLNGGYTVFAQVEAGQAVVDAWLVGDRIERVELLRD